VASYWQRLREVGLEPVDYSEPGKALEGCAGLLLTGGVDIDPALYGEAPAPETQPPERARDEFELALLRRALEDDLPVLAICRGHQLLNVCFGGRLLQHVESGAHAADAETHASRFHEVAISPATKLRAIYDAERLQVNSRHHQAVTADRLAPGLTLAAMSPDGLIEAVESAANRWVVGVQWHPEREEPETPGFAEASRSLFQAFATAIRDGR
jgi:putative glutamine amidotransferase